MLCLQLLVQVAFVIAERSLFLPSVGACLLITELVLWAASSLYPLSCDVGGGGAVDAGNVADGGAAEAPKAAGDSPVPAPAPATASTVNASSPTLRKRKSAVPPRVTGAYGSDVRCAALLRCFVVSALLSCCAASSSTPATDRAAPERTPRGDTSRTALRSRVALASFAVISALYCARTVVRNQDWFSEETLLQSNLDLYPERNPMSLFGLGCVAVSAAVVPARVASCW